MKNIDFKLTKTSTNPIEDKSILTEDFNLVSTDTKIFEKKFNTKPTTFLKDCIKRFRKNKSSVVAAFILGILLVMSILVPLIFKTNETHTTNTSHPEIGYLEPKLFNNGDFWSGKKEYTNVPVNLETGYPDADDYDELAISDLHITGEKYTTIATKFGSDGFAQYSIYKNAPEFMNDSETKYESYIAPENIADKFNFNNELSIDSFVVYDEIALESSTQEVKVLPTNYVSANSKLCVSFVKNENPYTLIVSDYAKSHNIGEGSPSIKVNTLFDSLYTQEGWSDKEVEDLSLRIYVQGIKGQNACALIKCFKATVTNVSGFDGADYLKAKTVIEEASFATGNELQIRKSGESKGFWANYGNSLYSGKTIYLSKATFCSFKYDTYKAALGTTVVSIPNTYITEYKNKGYLKLIVTTKGTPGSKVINPETFVCEILDDKKCPIVEEFGIDDITIDENSGKIKEVRCKVAKYKYFYNLDSMPKFLLGTDKSGRDMFIFVFEGLRTSLLLGICTTLICFVFGLIWGSICGYFGGTVDLVMERLTDILSGVPWIVVMTLVIIKAQKSTFGIFALALCLTGWIGTAATTRTQFYRFRGREYVLASRTLGASHPRLIAKHILPNAMGTIITSAVLMVPGVIFSEATISYLGLGFKNLSSLGVILSDNQVELTNHPYLLIFPSVVIALLMISFNLFGNGLRDAVNPSLKGENE